VAYARARHNPPTARRPMKTSDVSTWKAPLQHASPWRFPPLSFHQGTPMPFMAFQHVHHAMMLLFLFFHHAIYRAPVVIVYHTIVIPTIYKKGENWKIFYTCKTISRKFDRKKHPPTAAHGHWRASRTAGRNRCGPADRQGHAPDGGPYLRGLALLA